MTLDEAIKMCNRISLEALCDIEDSIVLHDNDSIEKFRIIRENHQQLEKWLTELKERRAADVQSVDRWIICKDEMPPIGCDVIVCYNQRYVDIGYYGISSWFIRTNPFEERAVSHWQPLPKPPKED